MCERAVVRAIDLVAPPVHSVPFAVSHHTDEKIGDLLTHGSTYSIRY